MIIVRIIIDSVRIPYILHEMNLPETGFLLPLSQERCELWLIDNIAQVNSTSVANLHSESEVLDIRQGVFDKMVKSTSCATTLSCYSIP